MPIGSASRIFWEPVVGYFGQVSARQSSQVDSQVQLAQTAEGVQLLPHWLWAELAAAVVLCWQPTARE
jgi:hypothetical protein